MRRRYHKIVVTMALALVIGSGCHTTQPFYFGEDGDLSHYVGLATDIEYPTDTPPPAPNAQFASAPLTLENANFEEVWELSLSDVIKITLCNSKVLRNLGARADITPQVAAPAVRMLLNPEALQSVYEPALVESSPGPIAGLAAGPEAALAAFDTELTSSFFWEKTDNPTNTTQPDTLVAPVNVQDTGTFQAQLRKTNVTGGIGTMSWTTTYDRSNSPTRLFPSEYRQVLQGDFRQPLLRGAGVKFNRIAGPFNPTTGIGTRAFDGVLIARIQTDRALADFEGGVRDLVSDVHNAYWELYHAYRRLEAAKVGLEGSLRTWQNAQSILKSGAPGSSVEQEAQARSQYFAFRAQTQEQKTDIFAAENRLRYLMGIAASDGRLIRPSDEPTMAKVTFEWHDVLDEALERNVELRRQKWLIKQRELEMTAAKNLLLPQLDAVGRYRWNGFGDDLISTNGAGKGRFDNAWNTLLHGDFQESQLGIQLTMNIGFRAELAAVRNAHLRLAREKAVLNEQELELSHLLADTVRELARFYQLIETNFNRRVALQAQIDSIESRMRTGVTVTGQRTAEQLNRLLDAQRNIAQVEADYYRALVNYNKTITRVQFFKGTLLDDSNVFLAEGPWPGKAYYDAVRAARQRDASLFIDNGISRPRAISSSVPTRRPSGQRGLVPTEIDPDEQSGNAPEVLPIPEPEPDRETAPLRSAVVPTPVAEPKFVDSLSRRIAVAVGEDKSATTTIEKAAEYSVLVQGSHQKPQAAGAVVEPQNASKAAGRRDVAPPSRSSRNLGFRRK